MDVLCVVFSVGDWNQESWRLLVEERIAKTAKLRTPFFYVLTIVYFFDFFGDFLVLSL